MLRQFDILLRRVNNALRAAFERRFELFTSVDALDHHALVNDSRAVSLRLDWM